MTILFLFLLGLAVGSFLNVLGLRWNTGMTLGGRSHCPTCSRELRPLELVPLVSFLALRGRCKGCKTRISWQYFLVEAWTAVFFVAFYLVLSSRYDLSGVGLVLAYAAFVAVFSAYTVILIYDLRHKIIPDELVYSTIALGIIIHLALLPYSLLDWLAGPLVFLFFGLIWLLSKGRAIGLGDAKLGASVGILLGAAEGFSAIVLAFWIGTAVMLLYMLGVRLLSGIVVGKILPISGKKLTMKSEIPFGPFIIVGAFISFVLRFDLLHVALL